MGVCDLMVGVTWVAGDVALVGVTCGGCDLEGV